MKSLLMGVIRIPPLAALCVATTADASQQGAASTPAVKIITMAGREDLALPQARPAGYAVPHAQHADGKFNASTAVGLARTAAAAGVRAWRMVQRPAVSYDRKGHLAGMP